MSTIDVPLTGFLKPTHAFSIVLLLAAVGLVYYIGYITWLALFSDLAKFPGPPLRAWTKIPAIHTMVTGRDGEIYPALHKQYGPVVRISPTELSFASGSQAWQDIYGFRRSGQPKPYKDRIFYGQAFNGVDSIIIAEDANHTRQRKILSHAFSDKALKEQEPMLKHWTEKMKRKIGGRAAKGEKVDMLKMYNCTTFDVMGDLTFAEGLNMLEDGEYSPWVKSIFEGIKVGTLFRGLKKYNALTDYVVSYWLRNSDFARKKQAEHWNYSKDRVDRRLQKTPDRPDLWSKILEKSHGPEALTVDEHHSIAALFMVAGTETTATALSGTTYHLLQNPATLAKLTAEIRAAFTSLDDFHLDDLARQKYLMAVLQEGLRMYPPVPVLLPRRVPDGGMAVDGQWIPGGTTIGGHHQSTYRSETHFKDADEFHPERWLGDPEFAGDHLDALEPFSVGPRNCLGKNLAWHEMRLLLATVILYFDLELCDESKDWSDQRVYTLWEKKPLICTLKPAKG
ncbi:hypothetical protein B0A55_01177 [Friedmanniomyces simplex]|uniref:Isotrichodermin C-15 hydroxylase n=1 Tax=Friedmanniomyces simplex TaxID=329884 RepID=A0A4U0Y5M0_9PEZI|nr:hypothetical protein B0A55_01177 [Friedmanniomyces simplex]